MRRFSNQLVYLVYGRDRNYQLEAKFSILSALYRSPGRDFDIVVYTDVSEAFDELPVIVRPVSAEVLEDWCGQDNYHHRCKNRVLAAALPQAEKTILVDTDTIFMKSPAELFARVEEGFLLVDAVLRSWGKEDSEVQRFLQERNLGGEDMPLINSGVIGLTGNDMPLIQTTCQLIDDLYVRSGRFFAVEQFALAVAAYKNRTLREANDVAKHYWSRKSLYRSKIRAFFTKHEHDPFSEQAMADVPKVTPRLLRPTLPFRLFYKMKVLFCPRGLKRLYLELLYARHSYRNEFDRKARDVWLDLAAAHFCEKNPHGAQQLPYIAEDARTRKILGRTGQRIFQEVVTARLG